MPPPVRSWRDVPAINPNRGIPLRGYGLGAWRAVVPVSTSSTRSGKKDGRGQPNDLERTVAERALEKKEGFSPLNAGGRLLMGVLDALDTPRAAVAAGTRQLANLAIDEPLSWDQYVGDVRRNITMGEATGLSQYMESQGQAGVAAAIPGFALDVLADPLTYVTGGAGRVGEEAGQQAARALLQPSAREFLGEAAVSAAERAGTVYADDVARKAAVAAQGDLAASRAAQTAVKYKSNQMLDEFARQVIGAEPGTYIRAPLKIDKLVQKLAPDAVVEGRGGRNVIRISQKEMGLGRVAGKARARFTQGSLGNGMARLFTKFPKMREAMLFGPPEDAAKAILWAGERSQGDLKRRLFETVWGERWAGLAKRAKTAGIDGEDLRYAFAEVLDENMAGPSITRVLAQAAAKGDETLVDDIKRFMPEIRDEANSIDPEMPWLMMRENYTTRLPSDEMIAARGGYGNAGGTLRRETFDFRRQYGVEKDQIDTLFDRKLHAPTAEDPRSVDQQIDDILREEGVTNWFEKDAYKAMPDYVRRVARRYGDEFMAKNLRDLGLADLAYVKQLSEKGYSQSRAKAFIHQMTVRATARADRETRAARAARAEAEAVRGAEEGAEGFTARAAAEGEDIAEQQRQIRLADTGDSEAVREYEGFLREESATLQIRRDSLMDQVDLASDEKFVLDHAHVELAHKINLETYQATSRITKLEAKQSSLRQELEAIFDRNSALNTEGTVANDVLKELAVNEQRILEITDEMRRIEDVLQQFEDLAAAPTDQLEQQLVRVDDQLGRAVEEYDAAVRSGLPGEDAANKVNALAEVKASILHEKGVIERARGRVAEVDRGDPAALLAEMDDLTNAQDMGDKLVHSMFPDLPEEIHGSRIRAYFSDRMGEIQAQIDDTQGQILSAFADRDSMRVDLAQIRQQRREAQRKLRGAIKGQTVEDRALAAQQDALLMEADQAANRALEIDAEKDALREALGEQAARQMDNEYASRIAEGYLNAMHARQLRYEAIAVDAERSAAQAQKVAQTWKRLGEANFSKPLEEAWVRQMPSQFKAVGAVSMTKDGWLVDALRGATVMMGPEGIRPALHLYDRVLNLWKGYALSMPGTVFRNLFGATFNNWLADAGIGARHYADYLAFQFGGKLSAADKALLQQVQDAGLLVGSGTMLEVERHIGAKNLKPWSTDFRPLAYMRRRQQNVENLARGTLAYKTLKDGGTIQDAIDRVMKYHFDYDDLSSFERSVMRRIVPFYTWTRKNFPLMLEQMAQKPTKFTRFYQLKNEVELYSPEEQIVPSYFGENLGVRLPFSLQGGQAYVLPDLPFTTLNDVTDPTVMFSQTSPFIKTPLEYAFGKQVFKNIPLKDEYQPVPRWMDVIPGALPALDAIGFARRGANGEWMMKQKDMYVMEQMLPSYGRARRLFPTEPKYSERLLSSWISMFTGVGLRVNAPQDQRNEAFRRIDREMEWVNTQVELGYLKPGEDKLPRFGQTVNAAYESLGVERE